MSAQAWNDDGQWLVVEDRFEASRLRSAETIFTIGNGRFSTRGSLEEGHRGDHAATLMHGIFAPHPTAFRELANLPDWTALEIVIDGVRFSMAEAILSYQRTLDLRSGLLRRDVTWSNGHGATVGLVFERFASLAEEDVAAVRVAVTAIEGVHAVEVRAALPTTATNDGLSHLELVDQCVDASTAGLALHVRDTPTSIGLAARLRASLPAVKSQGWDARGQPTLVAHWNPTSGETATFEKLVVLASSRTTPDPWHRAMERVASLDGEDFDRLHAGSASAWKRDWAVSDVVVEGDTEAQLATRFSLYHLLIAAPRGDDQVSIGAKTLSGFGYRGHTFWDTETFMLPFFTHAHPSIARDLLSYRWHRLPAARLKARDGGYEGAQIPWESADIGGEVTPVWAPNPANPAHLTRIWTGDLEIHISAIVAHAVMAYWKVTRDDAFMVDRGAEILLETARFWATRAEWNSDAGRYEFTDVIGPDEYHEHVDNNAFTNYLAAWNLRTAADVSRWLQRTDPAQASRLRVDEAETQRFLSVADTIYLPLDKKTGLIEQFSGYFSLQDVDLSAYADRTTSMQAILELEGINQTQVIKQPDVLMLAYLLPEFFPGEALAANYAYYNPRTDHAYGSSLGPAIQAMLAVRMGNIEDAYAHFVRAAGADLRDVRGNTRDGIHGASAGGLWQALVFGFGGVRLQGDTLVANPRLPAHWTRLAFRLQHRGRALEFDLRHPEQAAAPPSVRGLIFDLDGVITNTAELHYRAWQRLADEEGLPFNRRSNEALRGISRRESLRIVLDGKPVSEARAQILMDRKNRYYRESLKSLNPRDILPGAIELVDAAREHGLSVAVASASKNAREVLDRLGIADRFDAICDGNTVSVAKPAPDLFLAAAKALGLDPSACVVIEDATDGVKAAHAAGMPVVGIGPTERVGEADIILPDLVRADLDVVLDIDCKEIGSTAGTA